MPKPLATLLIVDDVPSIRLSISHLLTEIGYSVRCAEDGFSALREIRIEVPKLLLSDLNMPGMSGFELLSIVRRRFPSIQTIAMSGSFSGNEVPSGVAADAFFQKGSSLRTLLRILETVPGTERELSSYAPALKPACIHINDEDSFGDAAVKICCPECLRDFSKPSDSSISSSGEIICIHCRSQIQYSSVDLAYELCVQSIHRSDAERMQQPTAAAEHYF
jgi:CheY-like chemotaxis protein